MPCLYMVYQVQNNMLAKFPEHVPAAANFFDINSPFWQEMLQAEEPKRAGRVVGQAFGWVDGYKKVSEQWVGATSASFSGLCLLAGG